MRMIRPKPLQEDLKDLGFGSKVSQESRLRLLNRDGSFNVARRGLSLLQSLSLYHSLLSMPWWKFYLSIIIIYVLINVLFAMAYLSSGVVSIEGTSGITMEERFFEAFFFSVQTFTTVGYGHLTPKGIVGNLIATLDAFVGLISFALATGLLFARFSKPTAKILFSKQAIIAPYRGITAFEFRIANARSNQLVEVEVKVLFSEMEMVKSNRKRRFRDLPLERNKVAFLPLHLTVVHPIDETKVLLMVLQWRI